MNIFVEDKACTVLNRLPSSGNGNPRYECRIGEHVARTRPDSCIAYGITDFDGKRVTASLSTYYGHMSIDNIELA